MNETAPITVHAALESGERAASHIVTAMGGKWAGPISSIVPLPPSKGAGRWVPPGAPPPATGPIKAGPISIRPPARM